MTSGKSLNILEAVNLTFTSCKMRNTTSQNCSEKLHNIYDELFSKNNTNSNVMFEQITASH